MTCTRTRLATLVGVPVLCIAVLVALAGELEPPGPPGPTMKPLSLVEPRSPIRAEMLPLTITQSGSSWYLAESIETTSAGIDIQADNVTIDLSGFTLRGGTGNGVNSTGPFRGVVVRNGTVRNWSGHGVALGDDAVVEDVVAMDNAGNGIQVGAEGRVSRCTSRHNGGHGITASYGSLVRSCVAAFNSENGIYGSVSVTITGCVLEDNSRNGIRVDSCCHVTDNLLFGNSLAIGNEFAAIWVVGDKNRIEGNHASENKNGYDIDGDQNTVVRNSASGNQGFAYDVAAGTTGNIIGPIRTDAGSAGPWDNFSN